MNTNQETNLLEFPGEESPMGLSAGAYLPGINVRAQAGATMAAEALPSPEDWGEEKKRQLQAQDEMEALVTDSGKLDELEEKRKNDERNLEPDRVPDPRSLIGVFLGGALLIIIACTLNAARFCVNVTESWLSAILFTVVIPTVAIGLELYADRLAKNVDQLRRILGCVFVASAVTFILAFVNEFAVERGIGGVTGLLEGFDYRVLLGSQCFLEICITFALLQRVENLYQRINERRQARLDAREYQEIGVLQVRIETRRARVIELQRASATFAERLGRARIFLQAVNQHNHH